MTILNDIVCNLIQWNSDQIEFNLDILYGIQCMKSKFSWREMGWKFVQKGLKICSWLWCWKKTYENAQI
jgi:hypothetical protein